MTALVAPNEMPPTAARVKLSPDITRILAAIAFVIREGEREHATVTQYDIVKSLFLADRVHLNKFGRPITYDNYVAMKHGPVPTLAYDLLKPSHPAKTRYGIKSLPWKAEKAEHIGQNCFRFYDSTVDLSSLAPSEQKALRQSFATVNGLTFQQVRELTHGDFAYKEAWAASGDAGSEPMSLGLMFDVPNFDAAEDIAFASRQLEEHGRIEDDFEASYSGLVGG